MAIIYIFFLIIKTVHINDTKLQYITYSLQKTITNNIKLRAFVQSF